MANKPISNALDFNKINIYHFNVKKKKQENEWKNDQNPYINIIFKMNFSKSAATPYKKLID